jgi:hypothetical protein
VGALANAVAVTETRSRPAVILGTSSDRIGTPSGRAYFVTVSKDLEANTGWPIAPYVGAAYGTFEEELRAIGGLRVRLPRDFTLGSIWDGKDLHPSLEWRRGPHNFTLLWVATAQAGFAYSVAF